MIQDKSQQSQEKCNVNIFCYKFGDWHLNKEFSTLWLNGETVKALNSLCVARHYWYDNLFVSEVYNCNVLQHP